jgi:hypothetical protein
MKKGIMKRMLFVLLALTLFGSGLMAGDVLSLDEAKAISAKTNKPILLDFFTEW